MGLPSAPDAGLVRYQTYGHIHFIAETFPDVLHSEEEDRSITLGLSSGQQLLFVVHGERNSRIGLIGARRAKRNREKSLMKNSKPAPELPVLELPVPALNNDLAPRRLDLSKAVRGKYYDRMQAGTNVILLAPDLLDTFPDSEAVNEALRSLKKIAARTSTARPRLRNSAS